MTLRISGIVVGGIRPHRRPDDDSRIASPGSACGHTYRRRQLVAPRTVGVNALSRFDLTSVGSDECAERRYAILFRIRCGSELRPARRRARLRSRRSSRRRKSTGLKGRWLRG